MEELKNYWTGEWIKFSEDKLEEINIDESSKRILGQFGLPNVHNTYALIFNVGRELSPIIVEGEKYYILGDNVGQDLGIYVVISGSSGEVFQWHSRQGFLVFMNSTVTSFLLFLHTYSLFIDENKSLSEEEFEQKRELLIAMLEDEFNKIDANAIKRQENYWPLIIQELLYY